MKSIQVLSASLVTLACVAGCGTHKPTGTVAGHVRNANGGEPLASVSVSCTHGTATTGADGAFSLPEIPEGQATVTAIRENFEPASLNVVVSKGGTTGAEFSLVAKPLPNGEAEPNDSPVTANRIEPTGTVKGSTADGATPQDFFKVVPAANGVLQVWIVNREAGGTVSATIGQVIVRNAGEEALASNGLTTAPQVTDALQAVPVTAGQTVYIEVNRYRTHAAHYELRTQFTGAALSDSHEPNDSPAAAGQIGNTVTANIGYGSDAEDWYEFTATASSTLLRVTNLHPAGIAMGFVGRVEAQSLAGTVLSNNGQNTAPARVDNLPAFSTTSGAKYRIKVSRLNTRNAAPYRIDIL